MSSEVATAKRKRVKVEKVEPSGGHVFADLGFAHTESVCQHGSPPRAWRQWAEFPELRGDGRFTSTRVETIPAARAFACAVAVHIHARGDN